MNRPGTMDTMTVGVFLLDDHEVVRRGLRELLEAEDDMTVVGEAGTAEDALNRVPATQPDVAVLDVRLPDGDGVEVCREIRSAHPEVQCLMLTSFADDEALFSAIMAGAAGYVLKQAGGQDVVRALKAVAEGQSLLDPALTARVFARVRRAAHNEEAAAFAMLSEQEQRVLGLIASGQTNRQIAQALHLGEGTIRNYVSTVLGKLGVANRAEAAAYATKHNLKLPD